MTQADPYALATYDYPLPEHLIAHHPIYPREQARLLVYDRASRRITHTTFAHLLEFIPPDSLIILNDTRVLKARIHAQKLPKPPESSHEFLGIALGADSSETRLRAREILFHRLFAARDVIQLVQTHADLDSALESSLKSSTYANLDSALTKLPYAPCICQVRGRLKVGDVLWCGAHYYAQIIGVLESGYRVVRFFTHIPQSTQKLSQPPHSQTTNPTPRELCAQMQYLSYAQVLAMLESIGQTPLPPYIKPDSAYCAQSDYQSVFASHDGAIAAPTASLHISSQMLESMRTRFDLAYITLHIGAGTFASVNVPDIRSHVMHTEALHVSAPNARKILESKKRLCVGTSALRSVEYLCRVANGESDDGNESGYAGDCTSKDASNGSYNVFETGASDFSAQCDIFLHPGNPPHYGHALLTNFHLPKSTLIMLVASMVGVEMWREIYTQALQEGYRFYSYGDGMLII